MKLTMKMKNINIIKGQLSVQTASMSTKFQNRGVNVVSMLEF